MITTISTPVTTDEDEELTMADDDDDDLLGKVLRNSMDPSLGHMEV